MLYLNLRTLSGMEAEGMNSAALGKILGYIGEWADAEQEKHCGI